MTCLWAGSLSSALQATKTELNSDTVKHLSKSQTLDLLKILQEEPWQAPTHGK